MTFRKVFLYLVQNYDWKDTCPSKYKELETLQKKYKTFREETKFTYYKTPEEFHHYAPKYHKYIVLIPLNKDYLDFRKEIKEIFNLEDDFYLEQTNETIELIK